MFKIVNRPLVIDKERYTVIQAARVLGVHRSYIYQLIESGRIKTHQYLGRTCLFAEDCAKPIPKPRASLPAGPGRPVGSKDGPGVKRRPKRKVGRPKKRKSVKKKLTKKKKKKVAIKRVPKPTPPPPTSNLLLDFEAESPQSSTNSSSNE